MFGILEFSIFWSKGRPFKENFDIIHYLNKCSFPYERAVQKDLQKDSSDIDWVQEAYSCIGSEIRGFGEGALGVRKTISG